MSQRWKSRKRPFSLFTVLHAFQGSVVTVELTDDTALTGILHEAVERKSVTLSNVALHSQRHPTSQVRMRLSTVSIATRHLRSVRLPEEPLADRLNDFARHLTATKIAQSRNRRRPPTEEELERSQRPPLSTVEPRVSTCEPRALVHARDVPRGPPQEAPPSAVLYVGGIDGVDVKTLRGLAEPFGKVLSVRVIRDRNCAFLHMDSVGAAMCVRAFYPSGYARAGDKKVLLRYTWLKGSHSGEAAHLRALERVADECVHIAARAAPPPPPRAPRTPDADRSVSSGHAFRFVPAGDPFAPHPRRPTDRPNVDDFDIINRP